MTEERIESNDQQAVLVRQWFLEAAQHPVWKREEDKGGDNNSQGGR